MEPPEGGPRRASLFWRWLDVPGRLGMLISTSALWIGSIVALIGRIVPVLSLALLLLASVLVWLLWRDCRGYCEQPYDW